MPKLNVLASEVAQLNDTLDEIIPKVAALKKERDMTREMNKTLLKATADLSQERKELQEQNATILRENSMLKIAVESFLAWTRQEGSLDSEKSWLKLHRIQRQADRILKGEYDAPPA